METCREPTPQGNSCPRPSPGTGHEGRSWGGRGPVWLGLSPEKPQKGFKSEGSCCLEEEEPCSGGPERRLLETSLRVQTAPVKSVLPETR